MRPQVMIRRGRPGRGLAALLSLPVVAAMLTGGCSNDNGNSSSPGFSPGPTTAAAGPDPCQLVTQNDVMQTIAVQVTSGGRIRGRLPGQVGCGYTAMNAPIVVTVAVIPPPGSAELWTSLSTDNAGGTPVEGLGDEAFEKSGVIWARKGETVVNVFVGGMNEKDVKTASTELARIAVSRL
ncbi:MAG: hypothetical protein L0Y54_20350 [Sporichthyaceae bacterium]|nr:hypothetical protein [Sporichthyaceae bacterium]